MSKRMMALCMAVVGFAGCEEAKVPARQVAVQQPVTVKKSLTEEVKAVPPVIAMEPVDAKKRDGGIVMAEPAETGDVLALGHDTPLVDHLARAKQLRAESDLKGALTEARRALFTHPTDDEALEIVARIARQTGNPTMSAEAWGRLATQRPDDAIPCIQQARALYQAKDYPGTVMAGRDAIARDPGNAEGHHLTGLAQLAMGELPGAIASFSKAVEIDPNHGWAQNNLGFAYLRANENEKAVGALAKASELLPSVAYVHNNYGVALERVGKKDSAKAAYQHAMDLSPKYVKARINSERMAKMQTDPALDDDADTMSDMPHPMPMPEP